MRAIPSLVNVRIYGLRPLLFQSTRSSNYWDFISFRRKYFKVNIDFWPHCIRLCRFGSRNLPDVLWALCNVSNSSLIYIKNVNKYKSVNLLMRIKFKGSIITSFEIYQLFLELINFEKAWKNYIFDYSVLTFVARNVLLSTYAGTCLKGILLCVADLFTLSVNRIITEISSTHFLPL